MPRGEVDVNGRAFEPYMKKQVLDRLLELWEKHSALRLGQLIGNVFHSTDHGGVAQYFTEDFPFIEELEKHYGKELAPEPPASSSLDCSRQGFRFSPRRFY